MDKLILKFMWKFKGARTSTTLKKENKAGDRLPDFNTYYKATAIKTMWCQHKSKCLDK